jgi:hypothetical protein
MQLTDFIMHATMRIPVPFHVAFQTLYYKSCGLKKYVKMKCLMTSCTRKTSNVAFQTLQFEKVRVCIFEIFSLFNLLFFHNFHIFSLFNLLFFCIFHIFSLFKLLFFRIFHKTKALNIPFTPKR